MVMVDLKRPYEVHGNNILYSCGWSPFEGVEFKSTILTTIVSGHIAFHDGVVDPRPKGMRLRFAR